MLPGDKAVEAYDHHNWYETPPDAGKTVCLAYRPDEPARTAPTPARRERSRQVGN